jgi:hypothetical protein
LNFHIKLLIGPRRTVEFQEQVVGSILFGPCLQEMVIQQLILCLPLGEEVESGFGSAIWASILQIMPDVKLGIQISRDGSDAGQGGSCCYCGIESAESTVDH